jgi:hypothetical protein
VPLPTCQALVVEAISASLGFPGDDLSSSRLSCGCLLLPHSLSFLRVVHVSYSARLSDTVVLPVPHVAQCLREAALART